MHKPSVSQEAVAFRWVSGCILFLLALAHTCFLSGARAGLLHVPLSIRLWSAHPFLPSFLLCCCRYFCRLVAIDQVRSGSSETDPSLCAR